MIIAYLPFLVALIGTLMFALSANAKISELGKIMFWTGHTVAVGR